MNDSLISISTLDGRYGEQLKELSEYVSEYSLIKLRVLIETEYIIALSDKKIIRGLSKKEKNYLRNLSSDFSLKDAIEVKKIERDTINDVKSVEIYLRKIFLKTSLKDTVEYIHFGLTSDDINNIAFRLMVKISTSKVIIPILKKILKDLDISAKKYKKIVILARTHGQPAVPTTFGKEFAVFRNRLNKEIINLKNQKLSGKLNGAVGNFNSLYFVYPTINWTTFSKEFISSFGLTPNLVTTQINPFEDVISLFQNLQRINGVLLDFDQDMWRYISDAWLKYKVAEKEIGSSTMPQKLNPINFENSEGNLVLGNGLMQTMIDKLYLSRLQRDLSNSTVIRNLGSVFGYCLLGYKNCLSGITKIDINSRQIEIDLNKDWSILTEALQTYLRKIGFENSYYFVSKLSKGSKLDRDSWIEIIKNLPINKTHKDILLTLTPKNYIGLAEKLADMD